MEKKIFIGLLAATNEEYQSIYNYLKKNRIDDTAVSFVNFIEYNKSNIGKIPFPYFIYSFEFFINDKKYMINLITIKSGYGKLNAVSAITSLINIYKIDMIMNFGACGSLSKLQIGDFVIPKIIYESSYLSFVENKYNLKEDNKFLKYGKIFVGLNKVENIIHKEIIKKHNNVKEVKGCSQEADIDSDEKKLFLHKFFNAEICDWESFSIRKTAHLWKIPSLVFRVVSDYANESFLIDYKKNLESILYKGVKFFLNEILPIACKIYILN
ncbi:MAG: hypothetical protein ACK4YF_00340 [Exilispira sp.]